jgi:hypothetical protein
MTRVAAATATVLAVLLITACVARPAPDTAPQTTAGPRAALVANPCTGTFPSYWQDPAPKFAEMWAGQTISNQPPANWKGPVFRLSDRFPAQPVDDGGAQPWRDARYDAMFSPSTSQSVKSQLARDYAWAVMRYIQEGNIDSGNVDTDWDLCNNRVRNWYHIPFQTYDALSGREFVHGLTREAPVTFSLAAVRNPDGGDTVATTVWAVGFYNPTAAYTLGRVWKSNGAPVVPTSDLRFDEGAVIGKLLFTTAGADQMPVLQNMPVWTANISDPAFCKCTPKAGDSACNMAEQSEQCPRSLTKWTTLRLLQFDIAIKDRRAPDTGWVYGTFVADGQYAAGEKNPWNRIAPLGMMWGNDPPPSGAYAISTPANTRANGFAEEVIFWDTVDRLNVGGGSILAKRPGHLGCNNRLNGPADNANSSCMSCHGTASVLDRNESTPPIIAQFGGITSQCVQPNAADPTTGIDAGGSPAKVINGISFAEMDSIFFANTQAGVPFNAIANTPSGPVNVLGTAPQYADGRTKWISLDYSLQTSISLVQWGEWQDHLAQRKADEREFNAVLPARHEPGESNP